MSEKKTKPKSDGAEIAKRIYEVLRIRLNGAQYHEVLQYASEKGWGVSPRQVSTYIRRADDLLLEQMERNRKRLVARRLAQREALFARAVQAADFRTALAILSDMDKLQGHYMADRDLRELIKLATAQEQRIRELEKRHVVSSGHTHQDAPTGPAPGPTGQHVARTGWGRESLLAFTLATMPDFRTNWHHVLMCRHLDRLIRGEVRRLMLLVPPRHGKSELASRRLPAYLLGLNPRTHVIACSYSADLASRLNRDVQRIIDSPAYARLFPGTRLGGANTRNRVGGGWSRNDSLFEVVGAGGSYRSAGVGGGITGMGFDVGIIDDPVKNREEADSPTIREKVWEWYTSTFWTRQAPGARILLIMTRWHVDDLAGRLLRQQAEDPEADRWEVVRLPALAIGRATTPGDERAEGEPLWPDRYGTGFLAAARSTLGSADFEALYQGNPVDAGGNHFKAHWFEGHGWEWASVYRERDSYRVVRSDGVSKLYYCDQCPRFLVVDPAASEHQLADYTVMGVFAVTPENDLLVLHIERDRLGVDRIVPRLVEMGQKWRPDWVGMEANGFQIALVSEAQRTPGIPAVRKLSHGGRGKLVRATPAIIRAENRQIHLPLSAEPWIKPFVDELVLFRGNGDQHDDQVDVLAYAVVGMGSGSVPQVVDNRSRDRLRGGW